MSPGQQGPQGTVCCRLVTALTTATWGMRSRDSHAPGLGMAACFTARVLPQGLVQRKPPDPTSAHVWPEAEALADVIRRVQLAAEPRPRGQPWSGLGPPLSGAGLPSSSAPASLSRATAAFPPPSPRPGPRAPPVLVTHSAAPQPRPLPPQPTVTRVAEVAVVSVPSFIVLVDAVHPAYATCRPLAVLWILMRNVRHDLCSPDHRQAGSVLAQRARAAWAPWLPSLPTATLSQAAQSGPAEHRGPPTLWWAVTAGPGHPAVGGAGRIHGRRRAALVPLRPRPHRR